MSMDLLEGSQVVALVNQIQENPFERLPSLAHASDQCSKIHAKSFTVGHQNRDEFMFPQHIESFLSSRFGERG